MFPPSEVERSPVGNPGSATKVDWYLPELAKLGTPSEFPKRLDYVFYNHLV